MRILIQRNVNVILRELVWFEVINCNSLQDIFQVCSSTIYTLGSIIKFYILRAIPFKPEEEENFIPYIFSL